MQISIVTANQVQHGDLSVYVNDCLQPTIINSHQITLNVDISTGINLLKIVQHTANWVDIQDVKINNCSIRNNIYLSWAQIDNRKICPATKLYQIGMTWYLPFGYPISYWQDHVLKKFPGGTLGTDIYSNYNIYYPQKKYIGTEFPQLLQDFYAYDFDFTAVEKTNQLLTPFVDVDLKFDNRLQILDRVHADFDHLNRFLDDNYSRSANSIDDPTWQSSRWRTWYLAKNQEWFLTPSEFPELFDFFANNGITEIATATISFLSAKSYVYPHRDNKYDTKFTGACQLYVPLDFDQGNWFKLAGVGCFDHDQKNVRAYNVNRYTHAAVNTTSQDRIALIARCVVPDNLIAK
jgi:hypothetical protein